MGIPNKISPLTGGGDMLPRGYLPAEFLEKTAAHYFNTNILFTDVTVSGRFSGVSGGIFFAIYNNDKNSEEYGLGSGIDKTTGVLFSYKGSKYGWALADNTPCDVVISHDEGYISFNGNRVNYTPWTPTFNLPVLFTAGAFTPNGGVNSAKIGTRIYNAKITRHGVVEGDYIAAIATDGIPCLYDFVTKRPIYKTGSGQFIVGMTIPQARELSKLPITEAGALTVSLSWEAQWDAGVQNALSIAAEKGWTITVQYRDPEPIATYLPINFLEITGYGRTTTVPYPYPHFDIPLPAVTDTDEWEFSTVHAVNFSTGIAQAEGWNGIPALFYGATTAKKFYAGSSSGVATTSTYDVDAKPHAFSFQQKGTQSYASFDGQELKLRENSTSYPSSIGVFVALKPNWENYYNYPFNGKKYNWRLSVNGVNVHNLIPALDAAGIPCMLDLVTNQPFRNAGTGSFIAGFSTVEQSRKLATLPDVTAAPASLTVSLPWEAQWDEGVQAALQVAADKGWTLTVQYRDPEVATRNMPIGFLESTGTQYIDTEWACRANLQIKCDYSFSHPKQLSQNSYYVFGARGYGYAWIHGVFLPSISNVNASFWNAINQSGGSGFIVRDSSGTFGQLKDHEEYIKHRHTVNLSNAGIEITGIYKLRQNFNYDYSSYTEPATLILFGATINEEKRTSFYRCHSYRQEDTTTGEKLYYIPVLDKMGTPCMYDKVTKQLVYNSGTGAFIAGFNTPEQSRQLAYLPDVTTETEAAKKSLTVSLPWEAQWDVITQAALQVAANRGWTITVQYREPEVTTTNIPISFLESTRTQYIDPLHVPTRNFGYEIKVTAPLIAGNDGYIWGCQTEAGTKRLWCHCRSDGQIETGWNTGTVLIPYVMNKQTIKMNFLESNACYVDNDKVKDLWAMGFDPTLHFTLFKSTYQTNTNFDPTCAVRIFNAKFSESDAIVRDLICTLDPTGIPCMYDKVSETLFYNNGTGSFIAGFDTIEQARSLAYLPDVTAETNAAKKSLTVSLPWEAQLVITYVPAALQVAADRGWTITVQYRDPEADNAYYNKYAACTTRAAMTSVNPDFIHDLTADGEWIYPLPELTSFSVGYNEHVFDTALKKWRVPLPKLTSVYHIWQYSKIEHLEIYAPEAQSIDNAGRSCNVINYYKLYAPKATLISAIASYNIALKEVELDTPNVINAEGYFYYSNVLERVNCSAAMFHKVTNGNNMYINNSNLLDFPTSYPSLSTASGMFNACQITGQQAIEILTSIPTWTNGASHPITLGIHVDYENDPDVLAAIALADIAQTPTAEGGKGWTVTVQWNGTATTQTASTFGLRRKPVYAKLRTIELPDGTTENVLDWGHYVTNWEENGYQEFSSIEEANEYFNINQTEEACDTSEKQNQNTVAM